MTGKRKRVIDIVDLPHSKRFIAALINNRFINEVSTSLIPVEGDFNILPITYNKIRIIEDIIEYSEECFDNANKDLEIADRDLTKSIITHKDSIIDFVGILCIIYILIIGSVDILVSNNFMLICMIIFSGFICNSYSKLIDTEIALINAENKKLAAKKDVQTLRQVIYCFMNASMCNH